MATQKQHFTWLIMLSGIAILAISRLVPHAWNFTPIAGMALFGGAAFRNKKLAFAVPMAAMLLSDVILEIAKPGYGFHSSMPYVYGAFLLITLLGFAIRNNRKPLPIIGASVAGTIIFFLVTNFGTWASQGIYPHTFGGLMECYTAGLAFLNYNMHSGIVTSILLTICGDLFFTGLFFGSFYLLNKEYSYKTA